MDILYFNGHDCSKCDNFELRCSLRSIAKYGKNVDRVFVVGYCPEWLSDEVIKIPYKNDSYKTCHEKHLNILKACLYAVENSDIGDEFLVSSDDHFYVNDVDFNNYPYYVKDVYKNGELPRTFKGSEYRKCMVSTYMYLNSKGLSTKYFALHRNMHCSRQLIKECESYINEIINEKLSCECWTLFLNYALTKYNIPYELVKDVKINSGIEWWKTSNSFTHVFSTGDFKKDDALYTLLSGLYSEKSKYEK